MYVAAMSIGCLSLLHLKTILSTEQSAQPSPPATPLPAQHKFQLRGGFPREGSGSCFSLSVPAEEHGIFQALPCAQGSHFTVNLG